jgi:hypothetical protein
MDWSSILLWSGVQDSPGRLEAVQKAVQRSKEKRQHKAGSKRTNKRQGRHFPSLKHSA